MNIRQTQQRLEACYQRAGWNLVPLERRVVHLAEELGEVAEHLLALIAPDTGFPQSGDRENPDGLLCLAADEIADTEVLVLTLASMCGIDMHEELRQQSHNLTDAELTFGNLSRESPLLPKICDDCTFSFQLGATLLGLLVGLGIVSRNVAGLVGFKDRGAAEYLAQALSNGLNMLTISLARLADLLEIDLQVTMERRMGEVEWRAANPDMEQMFGYLEKSRESLDSLIAQFRHTHLTESRRVTERFEKVSRSALIAHLQTGDDR